jgi:hypothetical protein
LPGSTDPDADPFAKVRAGTAQRIVKPGQVFSRCHVDRYRTGPDRVHPAPNPGRIYNICDDDPAPPQDVIAYAASF